MKIQFERSGGFAGVNVKGTIDSDSLPAQEASALRALIDAAGFFDLPRKSAAAPGADQFQYIVGIEDGARKHTIETSEGSASEALRTLLARLTTLARSSRG